MSHPECAATIHRTMTQNTFKQAIGRFERRVGLWLSLANAYTTEICASAGFEWVLIDGEHGPGDLRGTLQQLQALAAYPAHPVVRLPNDDPTLVKQYLDIGAKSLLIPMVNSAEQARALASAMRYPPQGKRGVGGGLVRATGWGLEADYIHTANAQVCLLVQIETGAALQALDEICAVDGVDGIFIGPADLAADLGYPGQPTHPVVQEAVDQAMRRAIALGKPVGTVTGDPALARHYFALGASFVAVGGDTTLLASASRRLAADFELRPARP
jgi:4-hydroxy-2-oxoheptanedioate aldolase